jgi:hypothetical protein
MPDLNDSPNDGGTIETLDDDETKLHVADPDDYNASRRLRAIHDARSKARKQLQTVHNAEIQDDYTENKATLGMTLATYYAELEPLLDATDTDTSLSAGPWDSLDEYAAYTGRRLCDDGTGSELADPHHHMFIYRKLNMLLEELQPLVTEQQDDTWEV